MMPRLTPKYAPARHWKTDRRFEEAVKKVLDEEWTHAKAAEHYGVSRPRLTTKVGEERKARENRQDQLARGVSAAALSPLGLNERRRVGTFQEFDEHYFGRWICPDCRVHHPTPDFHVQIGDLLEDPDVRRALINMPPYHAKVLALGTLIPTPSGWTTIGELAVGDEVFDKDGKPCRVKALSPLRPVTKKVVLGDGSEFLTDVDHRWWVEFRDAKPRFVTTAEIEASPEARRFRIPMAGPLDLPAVELPIDPYILGLWLGDGNTAGGRITAHPDDQAFLRPEIERLGHRTSTHADPFGVLGLDLRGAGVVNHKHVPDAYFRASATQRLALLQGLMDSDGTVNVKAGNASFTNKSETLAEAVFELAASLGWKPRRHLSGVAHHVTFCPPRAQSCFRLPRKTAKLPLARTRQLSRPFTRVEDLETPTVGRCIAVDSPTETFLAGEAMVPTGNSTTVTIKHTLYKIVQDPNWRRLIVSKSHSFARTFLVAISELLTNPDLYAGGPNLIEDWGPFQPTGDKKNNIWNADQIYVAGRITAEKDPTVQVLGVGGQVYGRRADDIICDDIATLENQRNSDRVVKMLEWLDKELSSRIGRNGKLVYVGTRVAPGDIYSTLAARQNMHVLRFACISDEETETTLWPDHFPYSAAAEKRLEMADRDWQLVYQNVDIPGLGASFVEEAINQCKDHTRVIGHYLPGWRLVAGLDPAGGNKESGYTALFLMAVDLQTGIRYPVDIVNVKSMRAPQLKDAIFDWADKYPLYSFRVETNGLQSQLVQYNEEIIRYLAQKGIRVEPHNTGKNKWDPQFGVESMAPLFGAQMISIPWGNAQTARAFQPWVEQLLAFPMGSVNDTVMASWFADLGVRDLLRRAHLPMFDERAKVPERIRRKRVVVDFEQREVRKVPRHAQDGAVTTNGRGFRRLTMGRPMAHRELGDPPPPEPTPFVNVEGNVIDLSV